MTLPDTRKLYQQVASTIMGSIMSGKYKPGERLPSERDLAVAFKVSRPTIREAMIALEIRGLAETRHGSGIYVTDQPAAATNSADLDIGAFELTEARRLFEGEAAALAATQVSDEFIEALERIARGGSVVDPALVRELVEARRVNDPLGALTSREREVLALMAEGRSNAGIARHLWVTDGTVEKHVGSILTKLDIWETEDDHRRVLAVLRFLEAR